MIPKSGVGTGFPNNKPERDDDAKGGIVQPMTFAQRRDLRSAAS